MDIIIGAGATGLTYASLTSNPYIVFEATDQIGGYCKTIKKDGFVWDYSGHFFHFRNPEMEKYICEYMEERPVHCTKHTQILYGDRYVDFPFQKNIHQLPKGELIDCLYDLFNNKFSSYKNFKEMLYRKFGKSIAEKFLIPYNEKLYAIDLNKLDCDAMGRFFPYADKEEIIRNFKSEEVQSYNAFFTYPKGGAIEYINSLVYRVDKGSVHLNEKILAIDIADHQVTTNKAIYHYDNLISTIPFNRLMDLCGIKYDNSMYSWNKVLVFNLGFDKKGRDNVNNWVYFPDKSLSFYRVGYYDNIIPNNRMSLYIELGFSKDSIIDVNYWRERVIKDLRRAGLFSEDQSLISESHVIMDPAYVHITSDSAKDVRVKKDHLASYDIYSIGRYGSWTYCSIEDGMLEAKRLVECLE